MQRNRHSELQLPDPCALACARADFHDADVARRQGGNRSPLPVGLECGPLRRAVRDHGRGYASSMRALLKGVVIRYPCGIGKQHHALQMARPAAVISLCSGLFYRWRRSARDRGRAGYRISPGGAGGGRAILLQCLGRLVSVSDCAFTAGYPAPYGQWKRLFPRAIAGPSCRGNVLYVSDHAGEEKVPAGIERVSAFNGPASEERDFTALRQIRRSSHPPTL